MKAHLAGNVRSARFTEMNCPVSGKTAAKVFIFAEALALSGSFYTTGALHGTAGASVSIYECSDKL